MSSSAHRAVVPRGPVTFCVPLAPTITMASHEHDAAPMALEENKGEKAEHGHGHDHEHSENPALIVAIGAVTVGGGTYSIDREGQVEAGKTTEFGVEQISGEAATPSGAWLQNPDGTKLCDPVAPDGHGDHWHFNVESLVPVKKSKFVLKVGEEEAAIDWARGAAPTNGGIMSVFKCAQAPEWRGFLELKLHGDAGDLELWLNEGFANTYGFAGTIGKPSAFDVPKETVMKLTFPKHPVGKDKTVTLAVRNMEKNEDEDGKENMRNGRTNYFIFPGDSDQDPTWLKDEKFRGLVVVSFEADGKSYTCDPFVLVAHEAL